MFVRLTEIAKCVGLISQGIESKAGQKAKNSGESPGSKRTTEMVSPQIWVQTLSEYLATKLHKAWGILLDNYVKLRSSQSCLKTYGLKSLNAF